MDVGTDAPQHQEQVFAQTVICAALTFSNVHAEGSGKAKYLPWLAIWMRETVLFSR